MAWSAANVPAADVTFADNDATIFVGDHILANATLSDARWNADGNFATADDVNSSFPIRYCYDRRLDTPTKRTTSGTTSWLIFDAGASGFSDFDVVMIAGHDFDDITVTQIDLGISDSSDVAGGTNAEIIETWSTASEWANNKRLVSRDLRDSAGSTNRRFSGVRYLGLKITSSGSETPQVGELWLGQRIQMQTREMLPFGGIMKGSNYSEFGSENRHNIRAVLAHGFENGPRQYRFRDSTLDSDVQTFLTNVQYGGRPFLYLHEPNTDIQNCAMVLSNTMTYVDEGGSTGAKLFNVDISEVAPFYSSE